MTVERAIIERILSPLRKPGKTLSLSDISPAGADWTYTSDPPVSRWIGLYTVGPELYLDDEVKRRVKVAAFVAFVKFVPVLADLHLWNLLIHQAGGVSCQHRRFIGRRLELKPELEAEFTELAKFWYNSQLGSRGIPRLEELTKYRSQLLNMGLDCNQYETFSGLLEGYYPVDLNQKAIELICPRPFPLESILGSIESKLALSSAKLVFIAPNSD